MKDLNSVAFHLSSSVSDLGWRQNSNSCLSSVSFDDKRKDVELVNSPKKWALKHNTIRQCTNDILEIFIELGCPAPKDCQSLLSLMKEVDIQPLEEGLYVYIGKMYYNITVIHMLLLV